MSIFRPEGLRIDTQENKEILQNPANIIEACRRQQIVEARATLCDSDHNLWVDLGCMKGVIPHVEGAIGIREGTVRDIAIISRVNKPVSFIITGFETDAKGRQVAVLSRRALQERCKREYIMSLKSGDVIPAKVTHLEPFGAFTDIGCGLPSLIPIDAISVSRISHPRDRFCPGMDIKAVVKSIEPNGRVSLTHKELLGTWSENAQQFRQGETVAGIVRSVEDYGIFIELTPNLAGLAEPREGVYTGQHASVYIKSLIPEKMKVKLIIIDSFNADYTLEKPKYFFDGDHMDIFKYSPDCCHKEVVTIFE